MISKYNKVDFKEDFKVEKEIYAIIGYIECEDLKNDFDLFIGDENEAIEDEKMYKKDKYKAISKFVKEMQATLKSVKEFTERT